MFSRREFPCFDAVETAVDCLCREAVILQNLQECGGFAERLRHLRGIAAAAHRNWRLANEQLSHALVTAIDREDVSALLREFSETAEALYLTAAMWQHAPFGGAQKWVALTARGCGLLRDLAAALPPHGQEEQLSECAETLYSLRRDATARWSRERAHLHGGAAEVSAAFFDCVCRIARIADTAEWLAMKNT